MDEWIICKLCLQIFDEPRMLTCQHTYCHRCLVSYVGDKHVFACPECRREMELFNVDGYLSPDDKIKHIPINRMIRDYLGKILKNSERCLKHEGKEFIYFCSSHKRLACARCILEDCKRCHEKGCITTVEDFVQRPHFKSELSEQRNKLDKAEKEIIKIKDRLSNNLCQMEVARKEIERKIDNFTEKAVQIINLFKTNTLKELQTKQDNEAIKIDNVVERCKILKSELEDLIKDFNNAKEQRPVRLISVFLTTSINYRLFLIHWIMKLRGILRLLCQRTWT